jgi:hypothetical protein
VWRISRILETVRQSFVSTDKGSVPTIGPARNQKQWFPQCIAYFDLEAKTELKRSRATCFKNKLFWNDRPTQYQYWKLDIYTYFYVFVSINQYDILIVPSDGQVFQTAQCSLLPKKAITQLLRVQRKTTILYIMLKVTYIINEFNSWIQNSKTTTQYIYRYI